jgi:hypothetical protein
MSADASGHILLRRGLYDAEGVCHREAVLRPLTGHEEMALASAAGDGASSGPRIAAATALLASCVDRIGGYDEIAPAHVSALSRGDRQRLLLHLRARLFGDRVSLVVPCPNPSCRALADMDMRISDVAPAAAGAVPEVLSADTPEGPARLREPTGADDELLARTAGDHRERAAVLWSRLVLDLAGRGPITPEGWRALSPDTRGALALALAERGSLLDLVFLSPCPTCAALLEIEIDPVDLLARELRYGQDRLLAEIHVLAWYYHWSEDDVLSLPRTRRWRYLELVTRQVEGRPLGGEWGAS